MAEKVLPLKQFEKKAIPQEVLNRVGQEKWWGKLYARKISIRLTWALAHFKKVSPNSITTAMIFIGFFLPLFILVPGYWGILVYFLALQLWGVLDCSDGELARYKEQFSNAGAYLDSVAHLFVHPMSFLALGIKILAESGNTYYLYLSVAGALLISINGAIQHSGEYYSLTKNVVYNKGAYKVNFLVAILREIIGHIEIGIIGSIALLLFFSTDADIILKLFFYGYILIAFGGVIFNIRNTYRNLEHSRT